MPFMPALIVGGQLLIAVADGVPSINFERTCQEATSTKLGTSERIEDCTDDEKHARDQLNAQWNQYDPAGRAQCTRMVTAGRPNSYVELLTCLEMDQLARKLPSDRNAAMDEPRLGQERDEDAPPARRARTARRVRAEPSSASPPASPPGGVLPALCGSPLRAFLPACR